MGRREEPIDQAQDDHEASDSPSNAAEDGKVAVLLDTLDGLMVMADVWVSSPTGSVEVFM